MNCDELRLELAGLATGDLSREQRAVIEEHLPTCTRCRRELEEIGQTIHLTQTTPLRDEVPGHLEREVFSFVEVDRMAALVSKAPLEHDPPLTLERRSMEHSGALAGPPKARGWHRVAPVLAPGLAASLLIVGFLGANWYSDAADARQRLSRVDYRFGAWGELVQRFELTPSSESPAAWPSVEAELMRLPRDHFGLVLHLDDYPPTPKGHVCQLWLVGEAGERTPLGAFAVPVSHETRTIQVEVPVDPRDFPRIEVTLEPLNQEESMQGPKIMEATLDF